MFYESVHMSCCHFGSTLVQCLLFASIVDDKTMNTADSQSRNIAESQSSLSAKKVHDEAKARLADLGTLLERFPSPLAEVIMKRDQEAFAAYESLPKKVKVENRCHWLANGRNQSTADCENSRAGAIDLIEGGFGQHIGASLEIPVVKSEACSLAVPGKGHPAWQYPAVSMANPGVGRHPPTCPRP